MTSGGENVFLGINCKPLANYLIIVLKLNHIKACR